MREAAPPEFSGQVERWGPALSALAVLATWELASRTGAISPMFFPPPSSIATVLWRMLLGGELLVDLSITIARVIVGFVLGAGLGMLLGMVMGSSPRLGAQLDPWVAALHPTPKIAVLPLILVIFGIGEASKIVLAALGAFFPMPINTIAGVRQIPYIYFEVADSYGASRLQTFTRVVVPGSLPLVMAGARISANVALMLTIAAELVAAQRGLGQVIWFAWQTLRIEEVYAGLFITSMLGITFAYLLELLTRWVMPWRSGVRNASR
jgi:ABC-type nitrate/sulfonate/bicarbonate transport system permease component